MDKLELIHKDLTRNRIEKTSASPTAQTPNAKCLAIFTTTQKRGQHSRAVTEGHGDMQDRENPENIRCIKSSYTMHLEDWKFKVLHYWRLRRQRSRAHTPGQYTIQEKDTRQISNSKCSDAALLADFIKRKPT